MSQKRTTPCCGEEPEKHYVPKVRSIPEILQLAPPWSGVAVIDSKVQDLSLKSFKGKYLVLVFYPYDFTFACPTELIQFNDRINEFYAIESVSDSQRRCKVYHGDNGCVLYSFLCTEEFILCVLAMQGADVVAASTDSQYAHFAWTSTPRKEGGLGEMKIPILADKSHRISKDYGILNEAEGIPLRALFVIDHNQILRHVTINEIAIPRSVDEVLRLILACQFVDKYGDICPIGPKQQKNSVDQSFFSPI